MNIGMIGYGNMGTALCQAWLRHPQYFIHAAAPSLHAEQSQPRLSMQTSNKALLKKVDVLILAVKPAQMATVLAEIRHDLPPTVLVISVAAGLDFHWFAQHLPPNTPVVRAIPNLAAAHGQSATPLIANAWVTPLQQQLATDLFQQCGSIAWISKEQDLDIITALAGSGLAYIFLFVQAMCDSAVTLGLTKDTARAFALQTLVGAASLAAASEQNLHTLQQQITSKAGTTAAALEIFTQYQLQEIVFTAMNAAVTRSQTLRREES